MALPSFVKRLVSRAFSIKGRLFLSAFSELLLIVIFSVFIITSSDKVNTATANEARATKIVQTITEIRFVTFENLLHHDERSYNQWLAKHNQLGEQLDSYPALDPVETRLIENIRMQQKAVGPIFSKLVASYGDTAAGTNIVARNQYEERLASQLVSKQQIEITDAFKLANLKRDEAVRLRRHTGALASVVLLLIFLITAASFIFVHLAISRALAIMQKGAGEISMGKFDYRIRYKRKHDEFGLLASTFNNMAASLQQFDRVKSEFVLLVSHQLRTPATAVKGFISLLRDDYYGDLSPKQREMLASAYKENERQISMINEILVVAQVETGEMKLNKKPTNIVEVVKSVVEELELVMKDRNQKAQLRFSQDIPELWVDTEKIRIVIENLVHNASKFSPPDSTIEVGLKKSGRNILVAVKDHGVGIAGEDLDKLFKKFSRVSSPGTAKTEGTGLGLYLAKRIVELHQGEIRVSSVVSKGTVFSVQLPINKKGEST